jgi:flagellar biosynthesis protein FlhF
MSETIPAKPGATYKFTVRSAEEAVETIRAKLGENAKVLSVRQIDGGLGGLFSKPKLEVIAQVGEEPAPTPSPVVPAPEEDSISAKGPNASASAGPPAPTGPRGRVSSTYGVGPASAEEMPSRVGLEAMRRDTPTQLPQLLKRSGFSESMLNRLAADPAFADSAVQPLHRGLAEVGQQLRKLASARKPRPLPARSAFLGTSGVGRTTALCKWLGKEVFSRQRKGRVLKAEFDRPNPAEGLSVFCEALGLTVEYYAPENDAAPQTFGGPAGEFLYADLPGISLRSAEENTQLRKFLDTEKFAGRVLVLNAAYDLSLLRRAYAAGVDLGATHVVFTHLDEVEHWARLWDFLIEGQLTPLFLATGPSLAGDCEENVVEAVLRKTLPGA